MHAPAAVATGVAPARGAGWRRPWLLLWLAAAMAAVPAGANETGMYSVYRGPSGYFDTILGDTRTLTDDELIPALLHALDQLSKYPKPAVPPAVRRVSREEIEAIACEGRHCGVLAIYRPETGIYLDQALRPETSLFDRSVLLHELVHYLQDLHGERGDMRPCDRWYHREREAYAIQKQFLTLVGSPVRVGYSAAKSTCADDEPATATHGNPQR